MNEAIHQFIFIMMIIFTLLQVMTYRRADSDKDRKWALIFGSCYGVMAIFTGYIIFI